MFVDVAVWQYSENGCLWGFSYQILRKIGHILNSKNKYFNSKNNVILNK